MLGTVLGTKKGPVNKYIPSWAYFLVGKYLEYKCHLHLLQTIKDHLQSISPHPLPRFSFPLFSFLTWTIKCLLKITNWPLLLLLSHVLRVRLCATPWTVAYQAPPSMGFSRQLAPRWHQRMVRASQRLKPRKAFWMAQDSVPRTLSSSVFEYQEPQYWAFIHFTHFPKWRSSN